MSELKFKLVKSEQEVTTLEQNVSHCFTFMEKTVSSAYIYHVFHQTVGRNDVSSKSSFMKVVVLSNFVQRQICSLGIDET